MTAETTLLQDFAWKRNELCSTTETISLLCDSLNALYSFTCLPAAITSHNLQGKSTSGLMEETERHGQRLHLLKEIQASQESAYEAGGIEQF